MNLNVCLIDDALLQIEHAAKLLSEYQIKENISKIAPESAEEYEINLKAFVESMITDSDIVLHGYTNPEFYNKNIGSQPAFDVVIYDWDYATAGVINPEEQLVRLISESHCFVYIYSHMDDTVTIGKIEAIMDEYSHRIDFLKKGDTNSASQLSEKINMLKDSNFSAKFAKELRINASKSVEKILVKLAHLDIEKFRDMMGVNNEEKKKDLIEFIAEKFKNNMMEIDFSFDKSENTTPPKDSNERATNEEIPAEPSIRELWHYRMYSTINDRRVRKGDIYKKNDNEYIMIMTPNCQLSRYHSKRKTLGVFNCIKLVTKEYCKDFLLEYIELQSEAKLKGAIDYSKPGGSLINQIGKNDSSPFLLPAVQNINDSGLDLLLLPKMFSYEKYKTELAKDYLEKADLLAINYEYITTLGEPFLSELTKEIYNKLQGNGVPDYTDDMQKEIKRLLDDSVFS